MRPSAVGCALHKLTATVLVAMLWDPAGASASGEDSGTSMFSFSGFGTLGVVHSSEDRADFTTSVFRPNGAGHTHQWSAAVDSRIGGQVTAHFTSQLSAMVQLISEQNYANRYTPHVEWANIKYQFTPELSVRVGRIVVPTFLFSDTRNVGYANPWVRPPVEVYSLVPVSKSDGVDASYRTQVGVFINTVVGTFGGAKEAVPGGGSGRARMQWVMSDTVEYGPATLYIAYQETHLTVDGLHALLTAFRQFGPQGNALADKYDPYDRLVRFLGVGGMYDPGDWFVVGEWATSEFHSVLGSSTAWYATGGYRWERFAPYLTYGDVKANSNTSDPGLTVSALPAFLAGPAMGLNASLNAVLASNPVQRTISAGVRWDFMKNVALKLQYDHTDLGPGSSGVLTNLQPDFQRAGSVNLFSATIDFVL
jgi:hypothetical protein